VLFVLLIVVFGALAWWMVALAVQRAAGRRSS